MSYKNISLAITPGSENGVGPELMLKSIYSCNHINSLQFFWCGDKASLQMASARTKLCLQFLNNHQAIINKKISINHAPDYDGSTPRAAWFLQNATKLALEKKVHALVTGPVEKNDLIDHEKQSFSGQTEYLSYHLGKGKKSFMTFMGGPFIMSLFTTHVPLQKVAQYLTQKSLHDHIVTLAEHISVIKKMKAKEISIVILGINPHAGEQGLIGLEEETIVKPTLDVLKKKGYQVRGPIPADGFFAYFHKLKGDDMPDVVVAMYHDQGLVAYKLLTKGQAVNVTLGLPIPRTSPAHGTALDLVGTKKACSKSSEMAIITAANLVHHQ